VLLPHLRQPAAAIWADTLVAAHLTHDDALSNASCLAWVDLLWALLAMEQAPPAAWWVDRCLAVLDDVCLPTAYAARNGHPPGFHGTAAHLIRQHLQPALAQGQDVLTACSVWHSGAYLLETLPTALYIVARHGDNPREAILQAVNNTRDNDTVAAIVGAAVGALHGLAGWPSTWIDGLLGRTTGHDDGQVFRLLQAAGERFGYGSTAALRRRADQAA
jgi:ADP-ribosylglycohydrolase